MTLEPVLWGYMCSDQFPSGFRTTESRRRCSSRRRSPWAMGPMAFLLRCRSPDGSDGSGPKSPDASENARSGVARGFGNQVAARRREAPPRCRKGTANPDFHLRAVHRAGAGDGWHHCDCRASNRRRRCTDAGDQAPSGDVYEHPLATGRLPRSNRRRRQAPSAKTLSTLSYETRLSVPAAERLSLRRPAR